MTKKITTDRFKLSLDVLHPTRIRKSDRIPCYRTILQRGSGLQALEDETEFQAREPYCKVRLAYKH